MSFLTIILALSLILPNFSTTVNADTVTTSTDFTELKTNPQFTNIFREKEQIILESEILRIENELGNYFDTIDYTEEEFSSLSEVEQDRIIEKVITDPMFIKLENDLQEKLDIQAQFSESDVQPYILPALLAPIAATVGRVALQSIVKKGADFGRKYLKTKIKNLGKNYEVRWDVKGRNHELNSLVVILQKHNGKVLGRVFAVDYGDIPLIPKTKQNFWHFHITPDVGMHRTLRDLIPAKYKADTRTVIY